MAPRPAKTERGLSVTWMGTAGFLVADGRDSFYIDPYVSRYSLFRVLAGLPLPPRVDLVRRWIGLTGGASARAVIVSHSHFDHALDAPFFARETGAVLVGAESAANVGRGAGLGERSIKSVRPGDAVRVGAFTVRFVESVHGFGLFGRTPYPGAIEKPLSPPAPHGLLARNRASTGHAGAPRQRRVFPGDVSRTASRRDSVVHRRKGEDRGVPGKHRRRLLRENGHSDALR
ncbi:MAG: MBL fold metallo-hydrolase [Spirochaetes bacterium]|nr:MBL fold metallo-hydrolase [Spirochaetota bacterium]